MKNIIVYILTLLSLHTNASCIDLLKLEIIKRTDPESLFLTSKFGIIDNFKKERGFIRTLDSFKLQEVNIQIKEELVPSHLLKAVRVMKQKFFIKENFITWARDFYTDLKVQLYLSRDPKAISTFELKQYIPKDLVISLLLERSKIGGFSGKEEDIHVLSDFKEPDEFHSLLKNKEYLFDEAFMYDIDHGDIIHMLQLDFLIYTLKKNNIKPKLSSDVYQWIGEGLIVIILNGKHYTMWEAFFDADFDLLTSPEVLNRPLTRYFNISFLEKASVLINKDK